jgi:hypothetical protein
MAGAMDLTTELDRVGDAVFDETGTYVASFIIDDAIVGEIEFPVFVQSAPVKLAKETEDGLKKSDVIWVGTDQGGRRRPCRRSSLQGQILVVWRDRARGTDRAGVPTHELVVVTRRRVATRRSTVHAAQRRLERRSGKNAKVLVDRRRSR